LKNPYAGKPDHQFWAPKCVWPPDPKQVDPVVRVPFGISRSDQVAYGRESCFCPAHRPSPCEITDFSYFVPEGPSGFFRLLKTRTTARFSAPPTANVLHGSASFGSLFQRALWLVRAPRETGLAPR